MNKKVTILDIGAHEFDTHGAYYLDKVPKETELILGLRESALSTHYFLESIPQDKWSYAYAEGKWTIKGVVQHLIDTERIYAYRALRIARQEELALLGFDEAKYGSVSNADGREPDALLEEYLNNRRSTVNLFRSFDMPMLESLGIVMQSEISVRVIGFRLIGHEKHHIQVIKDRYLE